MDVKTELDPELPACWLFFDTVALPGLPAVFAGHCHEIEYIGDCPVDGYLVPCDQCLVNSSVVVLTYDTNVLPPAQDGVIITPLDPLRMMLATELLSQSSASEVKTAQKKRGGRRGKAAPSRRSSDEVGGDMVHVEPAEYKS